MQEQQQKELKDLIENTHTKVDEINLKIDNKLDEILDNLTNISPETSTVVSDNLNLIKNETINVKTKVNNIETDTTNIKTKVNNINDNTTNVLEKTEQVLTNSNIVLTNTNEIKSELENISNDNAIIKNDITYVKSNVNSLISNAENLVFNTNNISASLNNVVNNESEMISKLDSLIENQGNSSGENSSIDLSEVEQNLNTINTNVESLNTNVNTVLENFNTINNSVNEINTIVTDTANDVTTINSNVATNKNNITSIKTSVEKIENNFATKKQTNSLEAKMNEILKIYKKTVNPNTSQFEVDPFKLNMEYTGKIETNANPTNHVLITRNIEYDTEKCILYSLTHTTGTTFSYNLTINFTTYNESTKLYFYHNNYSKSKTCDPGTYTHTISQENLSVTNGKLRIKYYGNGPITIHTLRLDIYAENITILPKKRKYKINFSPDKIAITKVENNNGYYLLLDRHNLLTPDLLNQEYTLGKANILDYDYCYDYKKHHNQISSLAPMQVYLNFDQNSYFSRGNDLEFSCSNFPKLDCKLNYCDGIEGIVNSVGFTNNDQPSFSFFKLNTNLTMGYLGIEIQNITETNLVSDLSYYDEKDRKIYLASNISSEVYFAFGSSNYIKLGYGKNVTGFYNPINPFQVNVYMNDGGYCVKRIVAFNEDKTNLRILSTQIIGTYDVYHETESDVYFVEKNEQLFMFNKNVINS